MKGRLAFAAATLGFLVLLALVIWQGSFHFPHTPADIRETVVLWAVSTLIFLLMVTLAFMLFRGLVKLYIDRQSNLEGARIRSRLIMGALALALTPVLLFVVYAFYVLNRTLDKWFSQPARTELISLAEVDRGYQEIGRDRAQAEADWIAALPETGFGRARWCGRSGILQQGVCCPTYRRTNPTASRLAASHSLRGTPPLDDALFRGVGPADVLEWKKPAGW